MQTFTLLSIFSRPEKFANFALSNIHFVSIDIAQMIDFVATEIGYYFFFLCVSAVKSK